MFGKVWVPVAVVQELEEGLRRGYQVPRVSEYPWMEILEPPVSLSEWLVADLGPGEVSVIALGLENPERIVLLDDARARRIATAAGLKVWGTLRVLLEAKTAGLVGQIGPVVDRLRETGMWVSEDVRKRILALAGELPCEEDTP